MIFEEKTLKSELLYEGNILNLRRDLVTIKNGGTSYREIIEHREAAVMIPVTDEGKIVLVEQFRKALERAVLEVPAGKLEPGEAPIDAARRELREETGYSAASIEYMITYYPTVAYCQEKLYLFLCKNLTPGETDFDESESIEIHEYDLPTLKNMIMSGRIQDAKTIIAVLMLEQYMTEEN